jgi:hypothetical protein
MRHYTCANALLGFGNSSLKRFILLLIAALALGDAAAAGYLWSLWPPHPPEARADAATPPPPSDGTG